MDTPPIGFTIGDVGTVRDRQSTPVSPDTIALAGAKKTGAEAPAVHRVGAYVADYAPLTSDDLVDAEVDAELEAMLATSTVVRRTEGV